MRERADDTDVGWPAPAAGNGPRARLVAASSWRRASTSVAFRRSDVASWSITTACDPEGRPPPTSSPYKPKKVKRTGQGA